MRSPPTATAAKQSETLATRRTPTGRLPRSAGRVVEPASRHRAVAPVRHGVLCAREDAPHFPLCARSACGASTAKRRVALPANLAEGRPRSHDRIVMPLHECATEPPEASNIQCFRDGRPRARLGRSRQEILDTTTLKAQHSCRFAGRSSGRLLIRRSLVRAQVGEPENSRGYVERRSPFGFLFRAPT